jgi:hypothetical protein
MKFKPFIIFAIISISFPILSQDNADSKSSNYRMFDSYLFVNAYFGYARVSNIPDWVNDISNQYLERIKNNDNKYSEYSIRKNSTGLGKNSAMPLGCNISFNHFYHNFGVGFDCNIVYFYSNAGNTIYDSNGDGKCGSYWYCYWIDFSPSFLYRYKILILNNDNTFLYFGIGVDFVMLKVHYDMAEGSDDEKPLYHEEFPKEYKNNNFGCHASIGICCERSNIVVQCSATYTHVHFDSIKEKNGSDVMRYSDGRKVSTSIDMVTISVGVGLHIGW